MLLEIEVKVENSLVKDGLEPHLFTDFPLLVHKFKGHIMVRSPSVEPQGDRPFLLRGLNEILRGFGLVNEVRVENIEFVTLDHLGRWVVLVIVSLVVLVPFVPRFNSIKEPRLPHSSATGDISIRALNQLMLIISQTGFLGPQVHV
jgi:hypothetical protein